MEMEHGMRGSWHDKLFSREGWRWIAHAFFMEWKMVWKEILFGFTVAGFISVFVPQVFWDTLFIGAGGGQGLAFLAVLENAAVAPIVAFFTFIDRKSTRLNSSNTCASRMPSSACKKKK